MLPDTPLLIAFAVASLAVILSPGPDTIYVLTRSVGEGRLSGIVASLGISAGLCVHIGAATLGLSKLFEHAPFAYDVLRYAGVLYLLYLAWRSFASGDAPFAVPVGGRAQAPGARVRRGHADQCAEPESRSLLHRLLSAVRRSFRAAAWRCSSCCSERSSWWSASRGSRRSP